ncbi:MAG: alpha/beta fold hydrolase, partial [Bacteroidales bacterium]
ALMDTDRYFIVCANILGSCYGTTGPLAIQPETGKPWLGEFPLVTVRDLVKAHQVLREHLKIKHIHAIMGGSLGGQQAIEWCITEPGLFSWLIPVATNARASAWGIAFNESQRMAIQADPSYGNGPDGGLNGMGAARSVALLSYRNPITYQSTQTDPDEDKLENFRAGSYQRHQGEKLIRRFNAYSYVTLSKCLDSHSVGRGRGGAERALARIQARTLAVGISTDLLFPPGEQQFIAGNISRGRYYEIHSTFGHDGFLIETEALTQIIKPFINSQL